MNDAAEANSFSVIATRLPYMDRRALSEAWFSALHLASDGPVSPKPPERRGSSGGSHTGVLRRTPVARANVAEPPGAGAGRANAASASRSAGMAPGREIAKENARPASTDHRARSYAPFRTSLTLGVDGERVALLLRREGATLHVVALCRPAVAEVVRRALACADLHLRASGEQVCARVQTLSDGAVA